MLTVNVCMVWYIFAYHYGFVATDYVKCQYRTFLPTQDQTHCQARKAEKTCRLTIRHNASMIRVLARFNYRLCDRFIVNLHGFPNIYFSLMIITHTHTYDK